MKEILRELSHLGKFSDDFDALRVGCRYLFYVEAFEPFDDGFRQWSLMMGGVIHGMCPISRRGEDLKIIIEPITGEELKSKGNVLYYTSVIQL